MFELIIEFYDGRIERHFFNTKEEVEMEVEFFDTAFAKVYLEIYGKPVFKGKTVNECWISYCSNKNEINKLLASGV